LAHPCVPAFMVRAVVATTSDPTRVTLRVLDGRIGLESDASVHFQAVIPQNSTHLDPSIVFLVLAPPRFLLPQQIFLSLAGRSFAVVFVKALRIIFPAFDDP
jgi:hypothetical protein